MRNFFGVSVSPIKKGLIGLAVLCVSIPVMLVAQTAPEKDVGGGVGSEDIRRGRATIASAEHCELWRDGSFTTAGNTKFPPSLGSDERGPGYGRWAQTGDREFKLTFYAVL